MPFILWRHNIGGPVDYATGWVVGGGATHFPNIEEALRYQTLAAAEAAIAHRARAEWQIRDLEKPAE